MLNNRLRTAGKSLRKKYLSSWITVFGKATENIGNLKNIKLVKSREKHSRYVMTANFKDGYPFLKELFAVEVGKNIDQDYNPMYLGEAILDLSKTLLFEFHHDYMQSLYGSKVRL